jgi:hypothetical protein
MRRLTVIGAALLLACGGQALAAPAPACLSPATPADGPVSFRDVKFVIFEAAVPGGPASSRQTVVGMQGCAVLSGTATSYYFRYLPVLYTVDGHLLRTGTLVSQRVMADDPVHGGVAHDIITDSFSLGYVVDPSKLPHSLTLTGVSVGACTVTADGSCAPLPAGTPSRNITVPACLADGTMPAPAECPDAASH